MSISLVINRLVLVISNSISAQLGIVLNLNKIYPSEIYIVLVYIGIVIVSTMIYTYVTVKKEN